MLPELLIAITIGISTLASLMFVWRIGIVSQERTVRLRERLGYLERRLEQSDRELFIAERAVEENESKLEEIEKTDPPPNPPTYDYRRPIAPKPYPSKKSDDT